MVLFHFDLLPGGWLGVDLFFVLSGFLITRLIVHEGAETGSVDLRAFWRRRARRLLPALFVFLAGVALYSLWYPERIALPSNLSEQMIATVLYVANWYTIVSGGNYWSQFAVESPLRHMWSLAIEEQFYVLFPLVMLLLFGLLRRRMRVAWVLGGAAVISWGTGVALLATGHSFERVYLGTDTRIGAVLLGACAGFLTCAPTLKGRVTAVAKRVAPVAFVGVTVAMCLLRGTGAWSPQQWLLMPAFEFGVAVLLVASLAETPGPRLIDRLVTSAPLMWLGSISYGLYLWHVPIMLATRRVLAESPRPLWIPIAIVISLVVSQLSLRLVEQPIRRGGFGVAGRFRVAGLSAVVVIASVAMTFSSTSEARAHADSRSSTAVQTEIDEAGGSNTKTTATTRPGETNANGSVQPGATASPTDNTAPATIPSDTAVPAGLTLPLKRPDGRNPSVLLLGDSIAYDLTKGFRSEAPKLGVTPSASSLVGCGIGGVRLDPSDNQALTGPGPVKRCDVWRASWPDLVVKARPDVVLLTRVASRQPEPGVTRCDQRYISALEKSLRDEIDRLSASGSTVAIASAVYGRYGGQEFTDRDDETDCVNKTIRTVTMSSVNAVYVPLNEWLCPTRSTCQVTDDGTVLRPDGLHFQGRGAVLATRWLVAALFG